MRVAAFFFLFGALPAVAQPISGTDPAWLALLHYSGVRSSAAPGPPFFLSPRGHEDPQAELQATNAYFDQAPLEAPCRYPARALYLGKAANGPGEECQRWLRWREAIRAKGIELVFAAAFLNSPSSMYGHTLLKFPRFGKTEGEDLLDYTLNYGAETGRTAGLAYVVAGLTGGFHGKYATTPFYLKVREYNFVENRDFWIYPLQVSAAQLDLLVAHAWELRDVEFPYFFLRRNCSFYLLEFLEVARPGAKLTSSFPLWSVPVDTIRRLARDGWIGQPRYRPSRYRRLRELRAELTDKEASRVQALAATGMAQDELPGPREPLLLEAAYELWRYQNESKTPANPAVEGQLLAARARLEAPAFHPDFTRERPPEAGHRSSRLSLGGGVNRQHAFGELGYRGTLHDLLADPHGYEELSELAMGDLRARWENHKFFLERAELLRLRSLAPYEPWFPRTAWSFRAQLYRAKEFACEAWGCVVGNLQGGAGLSLRLGALVAFTLFELDLEGGGVLDRGYRLGLGPTSGLFVPLWPGARAFGETEWRWRLLGSKKSRRNARLGLAQTFSPQSELRLQAEVLSGYREGVVQWLWYF